MSVQFGRWNFDGQPVDDQFLQSAAELTAQYGQEDGTSFVRGSIGMLFQPFGTTNESWREHQPEVDSTGIMLGWDGRLDNRNQLMRVLRLLAADSPTDSEIVRCAYQTWGTECFPKFLGDWALVLWDPTKRALFLVKDFVGTRHLFYTLERNCVTWSTVMDPLVLLNSSRLRISQEYIAGCLSVFPGTHLTPFADVKAVAPATFVCVQRGRASSHEYWKFDDSHNLRYRTDAEYEEHFRVLFAEAVRRRLRSSSPILAELSGGMDSTSIVCMADNLIAQDRAETPRLDTISYYDDQEPNWNERPFFSAVEKKRGRSGHHVKLFGSDQTFLPIDGGSFLPLPGYNRTAIYRARELKRCLHSSHSQTLLSGLAGDEVLGGVPTPTPELQDLFARLHWIRLAKRLKEYGLHQRRSFLHLWFDTMEEFLPQSIRGLYKHPPIPPWLRRDFVRHNAQAFWADTQRTMLLAARPSFQGAMVTLDHLRRQLSCSYLNPIANYRTAYPYLDRDLLIFLFAIPREQLVRPGQRRSLMRRAFVGLVPSEILARRRKAFISRRPLFLLESELAQITGLLQSPLICSEGWADRAALSTMLAAASHGRLETAIPLLGAVEIELWLKALNMRGLLPLCAGDLAPLTSTGFNPHGLNVPQKRRKDDVLPKTATRTLG